MFECEVGEMGPREEDFDITMCSYDREYSEIGDKLRAKEYVQIRPYTDCQFFEGFLSYYGNYCKMRCLNFVYNTCVQFKHVPNTEHVFQEFLKHQYENIFSKIFAKSYGFDYAVIDFWLQYASMANTVLLASRCYGVETIKQLQERYKSLKIITKDTLSRCFYNILNSNYWNVFDYLLEQGLITLEDIKTTKFNGYDNLLHMFILQGDSKRTYCNVNHADIIPMMLLLHKAGFTADDFVKYGFLKELSKAPKYAQRCEDNTNLDISAFNAAIIAKTIIGIEIPDEIIRNLYKLTETQYEYKNITTEVIDRFKCVFMYENA